MCVIAIKHKGSDWIPVEAIIQCVKSNPHGFAIGWNQEGRLYTFKTMDPKEAVRKYVELTGLDPRETALVFHARVATHGSHNIANCHMWDHQGRVAFAHNGVLRNIPVKGDMTDSETFFRNLFVPAWEALGWDYALEMSAAVANPSGSKFAFITPDGEIRTVGEWVKYQFTDKATGEPLRGKAYFSNRSFMPAYDYGFGGPAKSVASLGSPKKKAPKAPACLGNLIRKPVEMYGKIASAGSITVTRNGSDAPDRKVACDGVLFKDLLMDDLSMIGY